MTELLNSVATGLEYLGVKSLTEFLAAAANLVTIIVGVIALVTFYRNKSEVKALFRALTAAEMRWRTHRLKENLGKIEQLNFDEKDTRPRMWALLGAVQGQLTPLSNDFSSLKSLHAALDTLLTNRRGFSEAKKMKFIYELHGVLDSLHYPDTEKGVQSDAP